MSHFLNKDTLNTLQTNEQKEEYVMNTAEDIIKNQEFVQLGEFIMSLNHVWESLSTARLTKIIKQVFLKIHIDASVFENLHILLKKLIEWAGEKKLLRLDLECKLINLYLTTGKYKECLEKISQVSKELKKYDDKVNLISLYVYESRAYYELLDYSKAKSSLTSARALAVSSACPVQLQAQIDLLNGMYLSDEHSFDTAISYFLESLEGFIQDKLFENASIALRYIVLNKILCSKFEEITTVLSSKFTTQFRDEQFISLLCSIANVCKKRDLNAYNDLLEANSVILGSDSYVTRHLMYLYNILLDQNIIKIVEPYSHIKIKFISDKLCLSENVIEEKLRMMILDKVLHGILDHDTQCLILYHSSSNAYEDDSISNIKLMKELFTES